MKAILKLTEDDNPIIYLNAINYAMAFQTLDNKLRAREKYENKDTIEISEVRNLLRECMDEFNVHLDMLQ